MSGPALTQLQFDVDGQSFPIVLGTDAPRTLGALARYLPLPLQLHTPKIAGSHIYWHAPLIEDVEGETAVLDAPPGAFIYWPVRQFLEITFAPLQAETASVTVLGHLDAPVDGIAALAGRLKREQGQRIFRGQLSAPGATTLASPAKTSLPPEIAAVSARVWQACPADLRELTASRAIMHPAGPALLAESELRVLHEVLWTLRASLGETPQEMTRHTAALNINRAGGRLRDFCHLGESAEALTMLGRCFERDNIALDTLIDESIRIIGRLSAWADLLIPWNDLNDAFRIAATQMEKAEQ
ncbi:hypothetical protein O4H61_15175 [Roseovarius aestuarii]|nr:hypothetical protein [Roseovarius aestuarii]